MDHGPFVADPVAGWESKGALQVCVMEVAAEEAGVVRWVLFEAR